MTTLKEQIAEAVKWSRQTGMPYCITEPVIANPGHRDICHLLIGLLAADAVEPEERDSVVLTVFASLPNALHTNIEIVQGFQPNLGQQT